MCASRRVARIAAQLSNGKVTKAIVRRVFGQNTASVTASMSTRWKGSSSVACGGASVGGAHHQREYDELGRERRQERHQPGDRGVLGSQPDGDRSGCSEPAEQGGGRGDRVVADVVDLVEAEPACPRRAACAR